MKQRLIFIMCIFVFTLVFPSQTRAQLQLEGEDYSIELKQIEVTDPNPTAQETPAETLFTASEKDIFNKRGYITRETYPYATQPASLQFGLSSSLIIFENLTPSIPQEASTRLTVSSEGPFGYQITALQDNLFYTLTNIYLPNTSCDKGLPPCTATQSRPWKTRDAYGFGYHLQTQPTLIRPFPLQTEWEKPIHLLTSPFAQGTIEHELTFKINLPPSQQEGSYETVITILATPKL